LTCIVSVTNASSVVAFESLPLVDDIFLLIKILQSVFAIVAGAKWTHEVAIPNASELHSRDFE
jgi:hypothetical protein